MENKVSTIKFKLSKNLNKSPVLVVDFSNGCPTLCDSSKINFMSYLHEGDGHSNPNARRILVANNNRLTYKGTSFEENRENALPFNYFVGVRNKTTGRMKIHNCIRVHLKPVMRTIVMPKVLESESKNYREKLDVLTIDFGSKAKKRAMNSRLKYAVESSKLADALADIPINEPSPKIDISVSNQSTSSGIDYIPPQNSDAQTVNEVYSIYDIISEEEDKYLIDEAENLLSESATLTDTYCKYVIHHLDKGISIQKAKYLVYYNYMVMFSKLGYADIRKKDPAPDIPEPYKSKLLELFTSSSYTESGKCTRTCPKRMKDKLVAYLLVLALLIDDFRVDIALVASDLKYGLTGLVNIAKALGCHISQRKVQDSLLKFAELKLPLFVFQRYFKK